MKYILIFFFILSGSFYGNSQDSNPMSDSTGLEPHSLKVIASVKSADYDHMVIIIEHVVAYSRGISATPIEGDELTVRLPGRNKPEIESRIEVDLKESIDVGALPSSYIALGYRSIN